MACGCDPTQIEIVERVLGGTLITHTHKPNPCCRCCEAAVERGEDIGHQVGNDCPHPPCDIHQPINA